ncbi:MAG: DUF3105 domain-containing protein [Anaerolineae bacterium]|nr:DUF3105 domain-containing protein [Anaerolineae bacterium]
MTRANKNRAQAARQTRQIPWLWIGLGIVALVFLGTLLFSATQTRPIEGIEIFPSVSAGHTDEAVTYAQTPPVGGEHNPVWQNCGIYDQPLRNENAVHSMEHGALWITYQPDLPADQVSQLQNLARGQRYVLLSPFEDLPSAIAASGWGAQIKMNNANDPRLPNFISTYQNGPFTPERGATCAGGLGTPLG